MTSKELVEVCKKNETCKECAYMEICIAYRSQFLIYPCEVKPNWKYTYDEYSNVEIHI